MAWLAALSGQGLRAQYFPDAGWAGTPIAGGLDATISTSTLSRHWWLDPPEQFSVQWSGYLFVERPGLYTFSTTSDDGTLLDVDSQRVVDNGGIHAEATRTGQIQLERGAHHVVLQYSQEGGPYALSWAWGRDSEGLAPVPRWVLSPRPRAFWIAELARGVEWAWLVACAFAALAVARSGWRPSPRQLRIAALTVVAAGLAAFYVAGAVEHARTVNTFKARGDQSLYLGEAQQIYRNWQGQSPPVLVGRRNQMPLFGAYLALFWDPQGSDAAFFEQAKMLNIGLSVALMAMLAWLFRANLPPLVATNLTLIVAFGYFVFRAGYAQGELLFFTLFFAAFLACWSLLRSPDARGRLWTAAVAGVVAALAHLSKASALPLVGIFLAVYGADIVGGLVANRRGANAMGHARPQKAFLRRGLAALVMIGCFFGALYPYISNSKRAFGSYFYNVNTTFYAWYDDWPEASVGTRLHHDDTGWPDLPPSEIPSPGKYVRTHSVADILERIGGGFEDMAVRSYRTFWYLKYVVLYCGFAVVLALVNRAAFASLVRRRWALVVFLAIYAGVYATAVAFYSPISGTGTTRFLQPHLAPLLFVLSLFFTSKPFSETRWSFGDTTFTAAHFHLVVFATLALDLVFTVWPRLMTTYGGF